MGQYVSPKVIIDVASEKKEEKILTPDPKMLAYSCLLWTTASGLWFLNLGELAIFKWHHLHAVVFTLDLPGLFRHM